MNDLGQSLEAYLDELAGNVPERSFISLPFGPAPLSANAHVWPVQSTRDCLEHVVSALVPPLCAVCRRCQALTHIVVSGDVMWHAQVFLEDCEVNKRKCASPRLNALVQQQKVRPGALHPNLPRIFKVVETDKAFYMLMVRAPAVDGNDRPLVLRSDSLNGAVTRSGAGTRLKG